MKHKTLSGVEVKDEGRIEAVFSTLNVVDSDGDVLLPGAFTDGAKVRISAYGHQSWMGALPVGKGVIRATDSEAILDGQFFLGTTHGRDTFGVVKEMGDLQEWSYSLEDVTSHEGELDGRPANFIEKVSVAEVSPVLKGASVNTRTLTAKGEDLKFADEAALVMAGVSSLIDRAAEVVTMRREKGKTLGSPSRHLLEWLAADLKRLDGLLDEEESPDPRDEATREFMRFLATTA